MKAVVFHDSKDMRVEEVPDPRIEDPRDAIVRVTSTAICGSDLHIYNGFMPQKEPMVMGHEFMGVIEETGSAITKLRKGDRVVVPFPVACGTCFFCDHSLPGHCENSNPEKYGPEGGMIDQKGGGLFGYTDLYGGYDGGQAQYVRVPYADFGPRKVRGGLQRRSSAFPDRYFPDRVQRDRMGRPEGWRNRGGLRLRPSRADVAEVRLGPRRRSGHWDRHSTVSARDGGKGCAFRDDQRRDRRRGRAHSRDDRWPRRGCLRGCGRHGSGPLDAWTK